MARIASFMTIVRSALVECSDEITGEHVDDVAQYVCNKVYDEAAIHFPVKVGDETVIAAYSRNDALGDKLTAEVGNKT